MARGGFFSNRISKALDRVLRIRRAPPPALPREPPSKEPPSPRDEYRKIWREHKGTGNYRKHLNVFHSMVDPVTRDEPEIRPELWESYIDNMVKSRGRFRRQSTENLFWRDTGIDPQDFNWARWREAMGYTGKRRSRTP